MYEKCKHLIQFSLSLIILNTVNALYIFKNKYSKYFHSIKLFKRFVLFKNKSLLFSISRFFFFISSRKRIVKEMEKSKQIKHVFYVRELRKFKLLSNEISFANVSVSSSSNSDICNPRTLICIQ